MQQLIPPSTIHHSISGEFLYPGQQTLITATGTTLRFYQYTINHVPSYTTASPIITSNPILDHLFDVDLHCNIIGLQKITPKIKLYSTYYASDDNYLNLNQHDIYDNTTSDLDATLINQLELYNPSPTFQRLIYYHQRYHHHHHNAIHNFLSPQASSSSLCQHDSIYYDNIITAKRYITPIYTENHTNQPISYSELIESCVLCLDQFVVISSTPGALHWGIYKYLPTLQYYNTVIQYYHSSHFSPGDPGDGHIPFPKTPQITASTIHQLEMYNIQQLCTNIIEHVPVHNNEMMNYNNDRNSVIIAIDRTSSLITLSIHCGGGIVTLLNLNIFGLPPLNPHHSPTQGFTNIITQSNTPFNTQNTALFNQNSQQYVELPERLILDIILMNVSVSPLILKDTPYWLDKDIGSAQNTPTTTPTTKISPLADPHNPSYIPRHDHIILCILYKIPENTEIRVKTYSLFNNRLFSCYSLPALSANCGLDSISRAFNGICSATPGPIPDMLVEPSTHRILSLNTLHEWHKYDKTPSKNNFSLFDSCGILLCGIKYLIILTLDSGKTTNLSNIIQNQSGSLVFADFTVNCVERKSYPYVRSVAVQDSYSDLYNAIHLSDPTHQHSTLLPLSPVTSLQLLPHIYSIYHSINRAMKQSMLNAPLNENDPVSLFSQNYLLDGHNSSENVHFVLIGDINGRMDLLTLNSTQDTLENTFNINTLGGNPLLSSTPSPHDKFSDETAKEADLNTSDYSIADISFTLTASASKNTIKKKSPQDDSKTSLTIEIETSATTPLKTPIPPRQTTATLETTPNINKKMNSQKRKFAEHNCEDGHTIGNLYDDNCTLNNHFPNIDSQFPPELNDLTIPPNVGIYGHMTKSSQLNLSQIEQDMLSQQFSAIKAPQHTKFIMDELLFSPLAHGELGCTNSHLNSTGLKIRLAVQYLGHTSPISVITPLHSIFILKSTQSFPDHPNPPSTIHLSFFTASVVHDAMLCKFDITHTAIVKFDDNLYTPNAYTVLSVKTQSLLTIINEIIDDQAKNNAERVSNLHISSGEHISTVDSNETSPTTIVTPNSSQNNNGVNIMTPPHNINSSIVNLTPSHCQKLLNSHTKFNTGLPYPLSSPSGRSLLSFKSSATLPPTPHSTSPLTLKPRNDPLTQSCHWKELLNQSTYAYKLTQIQSITVNSSFIDAITVSSDQGDSPFKEIILHNSDNSLPNIQPNVGEVGKCALMYHHTLEKLGPNYELFHILHNHYTTNLSARQRSDQLLVLSGHKNYSKIITLQNGYHLRPIYDTPALLLSLKTTIRSNSPRLVYITLKSIFQDLVDDTHDGYLIAYQNSPEEEVKIHIIDPATMRIRKCILKQHQNGRFLTLVPVLSHQLFIYATSHNLSLHHVDSSLLSHNIGDFITNELLSISLSDILKQFHTSNDVSFTDINPLIESSKIYDITVSPISNQSSVKCAAALYIHVENNTDISTQTSKAGDYMNVHFMSVLVEFDFSLHQTQNDKKWSITRLMIFPFRMISALELLTFHGNEENIQLSFCDFPMLFTIPISDSKPLRIQEFKLNQANNTVSLSSPQDKYTKIEDINSVLSQYEQVHTFKRLPFITSIKLIMTCISIMIVGCSNGHCYLLSESACHFLFSSANPFYTSSVYDKPDIVHYYHEMFKGIYLVTSNDNSRNYSFIIDATLPNTVTINPISFQDRFLYPHWSMNYGQNNQIAVFQRPSKQPLVYCLTSSALIKPYALSSNQPKLMHTTSPLDPQDGCLTFNGRKYSNNARRLCYDPFKRILGILSVVTLSSRDIRNAYPLLAAGIKPTPINQTHEPQVFQIPHLTLDLSVNIAHKHVTGYNANHLAQITPAYEYYKQYVQQFDSSDNLVYDQIHLYVMGDSNTTLTYHHTNLSEESQSQNNSPTFHLASLQLQPFEKATAITTIRVPSSQNRTYSNPYECFIHPHYNYTNQPLSMNVDEHLYYINSNYMANGKYTDMGHVTQSAGNFGALNHMCYFCSKGRQNYFQNMRKEDYDTLLVIATSFPKATESATVQYEVLSSIAHPTLWPQLGRLLFVRINVPQTADTSFTVELVGEHPFTGVSMSIQPYLNGLAVAIDNSVQVFNIYNNILAQSRSSSFLQKPLPRSDFELTIVPDPYAKYIISTQYGQHGLILEINVDHLQIIITTLNQDIVVLSLQPYILTHSEYFKLLQRFFLTNPHFIFLDDYNNLKQIPTPQSLFNKNNGDAYNIYDRINVLKQLNNDIFEKNFVILYKFITVGLDKDRFDKPPNQQRYSLTTMRLNRNTSNCTECFISQSQMNHNIPNRYPNQTNTDMFLTSYENGLLEVTATPTFHHLTQSNNFNFSNYTILYPTYKLIMYDIINKFYQTHTVLNNPFLFSAQSCAIPLLSAISTHQREQVVQLCASSHHYFPLEELLNPKPVESCLSSLALSKNGGLYTLSGCQTATSFVTIILQLCILYTAHLYNGETMQKENNDPMSFLFTIKTSASLSTLYSNQIELHNQRSLLTSTSQHSKHFDIMHLTPGLDYTVRLLYPTYSQILSMVSRTPQELLLFSSHVATISSVWFKFASHHRIFCTKVFFHWYLHYSLQNYRKCNLIEQNDELIKTHQLPNGSNDINMSNIDMILNGIDRYNVTHLGSILPTFNAISQTLTSLTYDVFYAQLAHYVDNIVGVLSKSTLLE